MVDTMHNQTRSVSSHILHELGIFFVNKALQYVQEDSLVVSWRRPATVCQSVAAFVGGFESVAGHLIQLVRNLLDKFR